MRECIDPTGKLPENTVFIPGYTLDGNNSRELFGEVHKKVYVSRSPCLEPGDAKLLSVIGSKPEGMVMNDWDFLCSFSFGTIIFSRSRPSLPSMIAGAVPNSSFFCLHFHAIVSDLTVAAFIADQMAILMETV